MMGLLTVPMVGFQCVNQFFTFHQLCQRMAIMTSVSIHRTLSVGSSGGSSCTYGSPVKSPLLLHRLCLSDAISILGLLSACEVALGFSSVSLIDLQSVNQICLRNAAEVDFQSFRSNFP